MKDFIYAIKYLIWCLICGSVGWFSPNLPVLFAGIGLLIAVHLWLIKMEVL